MPPHILIRSHTANLVCVVILNEVKDLSRSGRHHLAEWKAV